MHISRHALLVAAAGLALTAPGALASPDQSVTTEGTPAKLKADWTGPVGNGLNTSFLFDGLAGQKGTCGPATDLRTACDATVVRLTGVVGEGSTLTFRIDGFRPVSDFDLRVYTAFGGEVDAYQGSPTSTDVSESSPLEKNDPRYTGAGDFENKVIDVFAFADPDTGFIDQEFIVQVPYFLVANDAYAGHATLDPRPFVAPDPLPISR